MPKNDRVAAQREDMAEDTGLVLDQSATNGVTREHGTEASRADHGGWLVVLGMVAALLLAVILIAIPGSRGVPAGMPPPDNEFTAILNSAQGLLAPSGAATEFQKIVKSQGQTDFLVSTLYPLARLGLARAAAVRSDTVEARKLYEEFFALWKDADSDLPVLIDARREYAKMK